MTKQTEALKLALEALGWTDEWRPQGLREDAITALREALAEQKSGIKQVIELYDSPDQPPQQEPVAKPYAYEYGRDNGDGTYSVVIEKGDLVQTAPAVYNYVRPCNAHKDWPIKELFDRPQAQRKPLTLWTEAQHERAYRNSPELHKDVKSLAAFKRVAREIAAMYGIKENT